MIIAILVLYGLAMFFVFCFSFIQLDLIYHFYSKQKTKYNFLNRERVVLEENLPFVTIQLPLYNELYVAKRLIQSIAVIDYPSHLLEVQILDDSTDETTAIIESTLASLGTKADVFRLIRREDRKGYKAGALKYGLENSKGEYVAIFDADFLPEKEFLKKTIPYLLEDENVGAVQTRWEHLNKDYSILTKVQAFALDAHFSVEQSGRNNANYFINFNGTAGVWRKKCIEDAGNWQGDTITEDLDLSFRAQLKGWRFIYTPHICAPAELPATMNAWKAQQYRWNKGPAENVRKNFKNVILSNLNLKTKIHGVFHLLNSSAYLSILVISMLSVPILYFQDEIQKAVSPKIFQYASIFMFNFFVISVFYGVAFFKFRAKQKNATLVFLKTYYAYLCLSMGLTLNNVKAVIEGYLGKKTPFVRTPKFNIVSKKDKLNSNIYRIRKISTLVVLEGLCSLYFTFGLFYGILNLNFSFVFLHLSLSIGFGMVSYYSVKHANI